MCYKSLNFEWQAKEVDETLSVALVIHIHLAEGGVIFAVERAWCFAACNDEIAFVKLEAYCTCDILLSFCYKSVVEWSS